MGFQTTVNQYPAPAVAGDFASANPRASAVAGPGTLVAGTGGATVGRFGWADANGLVTNTGLGVPTGFIHRDMQALITAYLADSSMVIPAGNPITLFKAGDFWGKFVAGATAGHKVYAYYADGTLFSAATATPPTNAGITANTATNTTLTVTANSGAPIVVGQPVSGSGIPAGAYISALGTGTGGAGTYTLSAATTATATGVTVTATTAVETPFTVKSAASANELAKISTWG